MKRLLVVTVAAAAIGACGDPVHSNAVDALGGETYGLRPGPTHRPGQPCLVCHGGAGPGKPEFAVAGTIFQTVDALDFLQGAEVTLTDSAGNEITLRTNQTGNFYFPASNWTIAYPMTVKVAYKGVEVQMKTHVGRDGSCSSCHSDPVSPSAVGHVYLVADPKAFPK
ncbi:MAG: hypothetical protein ACXWUG_05870 [Polyangiales bacterium]